MKRLFALLVSTLATVILAGCGGGGGMSGDSGQTKTFHVDPDQPAQGTIGNTTVTVPSGAYHSGADVTMTVRAHSQDQKVASQLLNSPGELQVVSGVTPQGVLSAEFKNVTTESSNDAIALAKVGGLWYVVDYTLVGETVKVDLKLPDNKLPVSGQSVLDWMIDWGWVGPIEHKLELISLAGDGDLGDNSLIVVHGMRKNVHELDNLARQVVLPTGSYRNVYALSYDWRISSAEAATFLAAKLNEAQARGVHKFIDILGHSRGVLVVRHTLEKLGCTKTIATAYLLMGPNEGTIAANKDDACRKIIEWMLNISSLSPSGTLLCGFSAPALDELYANSPYTRDLNGNHQQNGEVHYILAAAGRDTLVPENSALIKDYQIEAITGGAIQRVTYPDFEHSTIVEEQRGINELIKLMQTNHGRYLDFSADPNPVDFDYWAGCWEFTLGFGNSGSNSVNIHDIPLELYDRNGKWLGRQWYDPNTPDGESFPTTPVVLNHRLDPSQWWNDLKMVAWRSDSEDSKAMTVVVTLRCSGPDGSDDTEVTYNVVLQDGDIYPTPPDTRSRGRAENGLKLLHKPTDKPKK